MIRRLTLGIGAALLVGGWGTMQWSDRDASEVWLTSRIPREQMVAKRARAPIVYGAGVVSMAVGAGLIGFAVLRPTNHNDE